MPVLKRLEKVRARARSGAAAALMPLGRRLRLRSGLPASRIVNDIHSQLNRTRVRTIIRPDSLAALREVVRRASETGRKISVAGGRHAMGGQQFGENTLLLDLSGLNRIVSFDPERGVVEVEAGIQWPELVSSLAEMQRGRSMQWGIIQKQTGADRLTIGGALAANIHGRGLTLKPFIQDVESFLIVTSEGSVRRCSRDENPKLFQLAIGGYGLFGVIARVTLKLAARRKLERVVRIIDLPGLISRFDERIAEGYLYGDFQFMTDAESDDFLRRGVFSCYRPVPDETPVADEQKELSHADWEGLLHLAHTNRRRAFELYAAHYLATDKQIYWSDTHQLSVYLDDYHRELDARLETSTPGSEMITEVYVPRARLVDFMTAARADFRAHHVELIYGTIRLIEQDDESFLAWAKERYSCIVFNLHVEHSERGVMKAQVDFRRLIDRAIEYGGSYYLTYHRWATRQQLENCYPQFSEFLKLKKRYDPAEVFESDWYRHHRKMFAQKV